jgi:putative transposase
MRTRTYPSDLTDQQWRLVRHLIPVYPGGRPRRTSTRVVLDAVFYVLRTGCQWRFLPKDFPPKSTVWRYFDEWRQNGTLEAIHDRLREKVRKQEGRKRTPSAGSIDSQSVPATEGGEERGYDANKKVNGRKRHVVVDTLGLLLAVVVTAASADDGAAATKPLGKVTAEAFPRLRRVWADQKYHNHGLIAWVSTNARYEVEVVRRPAGAKGFVVLPKRWVVERTFAWLKRCRRLTADREKSVRSSEAMIRLAMIRLMLHRLRPTNDEADFRYRKSA